MTFCALDAMVAVVSIPSTLVPSTLAVANTSLVGCFLGSVVHLVGKHRSSGRVTQLQSDTPGSIDIVLKIKQPKTHMRRSSRRNA